jgi:subtilisin family serine protease
VIRWAVPVLLAASLAACADSPVRIGSGALPDQVTRSPERYIIAAVSNEPVAFMAHAGSTPRGYDMISTYGPTSRARQLMREVESDYMLREVNAWPIESLHMHCAVLEIPAGADRDALLAKLSQDRRVSLTQPVQTFAMRTDARRADAYNDPYVGLQRGFQQMEVAEAHAWSRGDGVRVAVIDTGADVNHPDLRGRIAAAANFVDADDGQFRRDRHGTEMAGVIAAVANNGEGIVGIAPQARLLIFKACWQERAGADAAYCNSFTLARALSAAFDAHAQIINLSLAGPKDALVGDLIQAGLRRGVLFVGAATPAMDGGGLMHQPGVIEVASVEAPGAPQPGAPQPGGAQPEPGVPITRDVSPPVSATLFAPGHEILTLLPDGHYDFASGASIATAQVSGVVALMLAKNRALSANSAYQLLRDTSSTFSAEAGAEKGINACAVMVTLEHQGACRGAEDGGDLPRQVAAH